MKCPFCRSTDTEVYNSRATKFASQIWRRRRCLSCQQPFTTYESADLSWLKVQAAHATSSYSRVRLYASIVMAFKTQANPPDTADAITDTIESKILDLKTKTVTTSQVAAIVLTTLKHFDTAAFLHYLASHAELRSSAELKRQLKNY